MKRKLGYAILIVITLAFFIGFALALHTPEDREPITHTGIVVAIKTTSPIGGWHRIYFADGATFNVYGNKPELLMGEPITITFLPHLDSGWKVGSITGVDNEK